MKAAGFSTKEIMRRYEILKIEHKWKLGGDEYRNGKVIDFHNTFGKQAIYLR